MDLEEQINFTNKRAHPTNRKMAVYRHTVEEQATYFGSLLTEADIAFERQLDEDDPKKAIYYGVARINEKQVDRLNYIALGLNRDKFVNSAPVRWIMFFITALFIGTAILGFILSN